MATALYSADEWLGCKGHYRLVVVKPQRYKNSINIVIYYYY